LIPIETESGKKFTPILLGSDMNVFGMARAFHELYGGTGKAYADIQLAPRRDT